jgi:hypothetical protein
MRAHDPETRAAVLAALLSGSSIADISRRLKIPDSTIADWRDQAGIGPKAPKTPGYIREEQKADLGERVGGYLDDILVTVRAQAIHTRDPEWLHRQNAHDLAILHGVLVDKAIRLLGALRVDEPIQLPDRAAS